MQVVILRKHDMIDKYKFKRNSIWRLYLTTQRPRIPQSFLISSHAKYTQNRLTLAKLYDNDIGLNYIKNALERLHPHKWCAQPLQTKAQYNPTPATRCAQHTKKQHLTLFSTPNQHHGPLIPKRIETKSLCPTMYPQIKHQYPFLHLLTEKGNRSM